MATLSHFLNLNSLNASPDSAHAFLEDRSKYSIVLNLLGTHEEDIGIRINAQKREIAVIAKKESHTVRKGSFWVFGVPSEGLLNSITTRFKGGVLEICIPRGPHHSARAGRARLALV